MTLFAWIDENGNWKLTHTPPDQTYAHLRLVLADAERLVIAVGEDGALVEVAV
jgi:hypothetical protein